MSSQNSKKPSSKVFVRSRPTEPLEIGPEEYRNNTIDLARGVVSDVKYTIQPTAKPQVTSSKPPESNKSEYSSKPKTPKSNQPGHSSKQNATTKGSDVHRQAQEVVSSLKNIIRPTAKPCKPSEITGPENDAILESDGTSSDGTPSDAGSDGTVTSEEPGKLLSISDIKLSDHMEYLARPKKGMLYQDGFECPEGAIPEKHLPTWKFLPLHNKIPADRFPYQINMANVPENTFSTTSKDEMNLNDISDDRYYNSLMDPGLKSYFEREGVRKHLLDSGQVTESGRIVCTLKQLNDYRRYLARVQARAERMRLKAEHEEEKRAKEEKRREEAVKREEKREMKKTQTALREQIKHSVEAAKNESAMAAQIERDKRIINRGIRLRQEAFEREQKAEKARAQRAEDEKQEQKRRKNIELAMAKQDVKRIEKLCKRKEEEKLERIRKREEFWDRKAKIQSEWLEKGFDLERKWLEEREENVKARKEKLCEPEKRDGETLDDTSAEGKDSPRPSKESSDDEETQSSTSSNENLREETESSTSSKETLREKTVSPTSSKEITLENMLQKEIQSTASYEYMRGNPSREEILTPVSSKEITLENILRKETEPRAALTKETEPRPAVTKETEPRAALTKETEPRADLTKETESRAALTKGTGLKRPSYFDEWKSV